MTFFELLFVCLCLCGGLAGGYFGTAAFGWPGVVVFFVMGVSGAFGFFEALGRAMEALHSWGGDECSCGECGKTDFRWFDELDGHPVKQWRCGCRHVKRDGELVQLEESDPESSDPRR